MWNLWRNIKTQYVFYLSWQASMFVLVIFISLTFYLDVYTSDFQHDLEFVFFFDEIFFVLCPIKFLGCSLLVQVQDDS